MLIPCERKHFARFSRAWNWAPLVEAALLADAALLLDALEEPQPASAAPTARTARTVSTAAIARPRCSKGNGRVIFGKLLNRRVACVVAPAPSALRKRSSDSLRR